MMDKSSSVSFFPLPFITFAFGILSSFPLILMQKPDYIYICLSHIWALL
jgi:hypothetical protein